MSRHNYSDEIDDNWSWIRWNGVVASSIRGKRGQKLLKDLAEAMDAMPVKRLIPNELKTANGEVCALGVLGQKRGIDLDKIDPEDCETVAKEFDIAEPLAREITYQNDEECFGTPEVRWTKMRAWVQSKIKAL